MLRTKQKYNLIMIVFAAVCIFWGCGINDGNRAGDCTLVVSFNSVPQEFYSLDENLTDSFYICVVVENMLTEKNHNIILDKSGGFEYTAKLNPGSYHIKNVYAYNANVIGIELSADIESFELSRDNPRVINVVISNEEEFIRSCDMIANASEMKDMDKFSGMIKTGDDICSLEDLKNLINLVTENGNTIIKPYSSEEYTDELKGITIKLLNETGESRDYKDCRVISVTITGRSCVLPGCVAIGQSGEYVCNAVTGVYGQPHKFEGNALYGYSFGTTDCIYYDASTGDRITISIDDIGGFISRIKYEMEQYE